MTSIFFADSLSYPNVQYKPTKSFKYRTTILPVVLYGFQTWSLALREKCRLRVFENKILRRIFGSNRADNGMCRIFRNEEFDSLYRSPNIVMLIKSERLSWKDCKQPVKYNVIKFH